MTKHRHDLRRLGTVCMALVMTGGLACSESKPEYDLRRVGSQSWDLFGEANAFYLQVRWANPEGMPRRDGMDQVVSRLRSASRIDNRCPLYHSKCGEMLLEAGDESRAVAAFHESLALCYDWVPGYFGLATVEIRNRRFDAAIRHLRSAEIAIRELEDRIQSEWSPKQSAKFQTVSTRDEDPDAEEVDLALGWLTANEAWLPEDTLRIHQRGQGRIGQDPKILIERLNARKHYLVTVMRRVRGDSPQEIFNGPLDDSIDADPNFAPTRMEQAMLYRNMGGLENLVEAERILAAFVKAGNNPAFAQHPQIWYELATTRAAISLTMDHDGWRRQALEAFARALELSGNRSDWQAQRQAFINATGFNKP